jgi:hypothetical protein
MPEPRNEIDRNGQHQGMLHPRLHHEFDSTCRDPRFIRLAWLTRMEVCDIVATSFSKDVSRINGLTFVA